MTSSSNNSNSAQQRPLLDFAAATDDLSVAGDGAAAQNEEEEEASWLTLNASSEVTSWSHASDLRRVRERNKSLRVIFDQAGLEYGADVSDPDELCRRLKKAVTLRSAHIGEVVRRMQAAKCLDLCFLVDATGSMQSHMDAVKNQIREIVDRLTMKAAVAAENGGAGNNNEEEKSKKTTTSKVHFAAPSIVQKIRLAFVGYRDFGDGEKQFEVLDFTKSVNKFRTFCAGIVPAGGGDTPEDVFGGLEKAIALRWSRDGSTRMLFHIADAPCHGREYHTVAGDRYPDGDPIGRCLSEMLKQLAEKGVLYHFGRVTPLTDLMVPKFSAQMVAAGGDELVVCDLGEADFAELKLLNTVVSTTSIAVAGVGPSQRAQRFIPPGGFDKTMPSWGEMAKLEGLLLAYEMPPSIVDIINGLALKAKKPVKAVFLCAPKPFACGAERVAYFGRDVTNCSGGDGDHSPPPMDIVLKRYTHSKGFINTPVMYESAIQVQTIAAYLASLFCTRMHEKVGQGYGIQFLKGQLFCYKIPSSSSKQTTVYMTSERRYPANCDFLRFSNNMEYSMLEQTAQLKGVDVEYVKQLMAFSHWTYQASRGFLMVVDLQGILNPVEQKVELTDPAIHCLDETRFGRTNFGVEGIKSFFRNHRCNHICEKMNLTRPIGF